MNIGELAKRTGLTPSRIRFYESAGLLKAAARWLDGHCTYAPEALLAVALITSAQQVGFSLDEIRPLLPSGQETWDHAGCWRGCSTRWPRSSRWRRGWPTARCN